MSEYISLKWRTLKSWNFETEKSRDVMQRMIDSGLSLSAMIKNTPEQNVILCDLIDAVDCEKIWLDWDGIEVTKDAAKKYVMGDDNEKPPPGEGEGFAKNQIRNQTIPRIHTGHKST